MSALALSTKSSPARPVSHERRAVLPLSDSLILAFATAADVSDGVRRVAATLRRAGAVAGTEWWAPAEKGGSLVLQASEGSRGGRRTAIPIGPAGTLVVVGARSEPAVTQALTGLIPLLRRRWTEERLARHASLLARRVEALEDFAALVAHELKAPLQAALLSDDAASGAAAALQLVDLVLEAVRTDDAPEESAAPAECLRAALGDIGPLDAKVVSNLPERFPIPPAALRLVLRNLLRNAVAAGAAHISVWGIAAPARATLVVDDDGIGLDASGYAAGERLGLRLCERLLAPRGGDLRLKSITSGGTRASVTVAGA
jgi:signal transduction histidine kinase